MSDRYGKARQHTYRSWCRFLSGYFLALLSAACVAAPAKNLRFEQLGIEQGLPNQLVQAMLQDRQGFMWIGTQRGLARYDGSRIIFHRRNAEQPGSLTDPWVTALYEDGKGRLWVGTRGGGLHRYDPADERFIPYRHEPKDSHGPASNQINAIASDGANGMWLAMADGLAHFNPDTAQFRVMRHDVTQPGSLGHDCVTALATDGQGNLWVGTAAGLNRLARGSTQFETYRLDSEIAPDPKKNDVHTLLLDRAGALWVGTAAGLEVWPVAGPKKRFGMAEGLEPGIVEVLYQDRDGTVWLGTQNDGLKRWDAAANRFQPYRNHPSDPHSLADNRISTLLQDRSGILWVGTWNSGTSRVDLGSGGFERFVHLDSDPRSLGAGRVQGIAADGSGRIWLGTANGGLNRLDKVSGEISQFRHNPADPHSLSHNTVRAIQVNAEGVWVGTAGGLDLLDPVSGRFTHFLHNPDDPHSLSSNQIYSLAFDRAGILWVGTVDHGLNRFDPSSRTVQRFPHDPQDPDSLSTPWVSQILDDSRGNLWVGTTGGLDRLDRKTGRFQHFRRDDKDASSLSHNTVSRVLEDRSGTIWVGTTSGFNRMERGADGSIRFKRYSLRDGLENDAILDVEEAQDGKLWLGTDAGLSRFDPSDGTVKNFTAIDGLIDGTYMVNGGFKDADGMLYFGGSRGLTAFLPQAIRDNVTTAPEVAITDFLIFNQSVRIGQRPDGVEMAGAITDAKAITLPYHYSVFSLEFAGLHYADPQHNRYTYKLDGFDRDWVVADAKHRVATYTNLDPGSYLFRVKAATKDGHWSEDGASLTITITPPFWKTWWFRLVATMLLLSAAALTYRAKTRHFAHRQLILERQVAERTAEADAARQRLVDMTDGLPLTVMQFQATEQGERRYLFVGKNVHDVLGVCPDEVLADHRARWRNVLDEDRILTEATACEALEQHLSTEFHQRIKIDGRIRWIYTHAVPSQLSDGSWVWNGFWMDVTQTREQAEALRVAKEQAEAATQSKSLFLANMSHEIRTPMNAIMGLSRLALKTSLTWQQGDYINKIFSASDSLLQIINDILDFSKVEAGQLTLEHIPFALKDVLNQVGDSVSLKAQAKGIEFLFDLGAEVPRALLGDPLRLGQIIINLTNNAVKFTDSGEILVRIRCANESSNSANSVLLQISVKDTGLGIAPEQLPTLFRPFTQADTSTTRKYGGTGLGLAICKQLVEMMGGRIWVESEIGSGSMFSFTARCGLDTNAEQEAPKLERLHGARALVVDGSATARTILADMLEHLGLRADIAGSGSQALDLLRQADADGAPYQLMLIDWNMPGLDGIETTRRIRQDNSLAAPLLVLMATAYDFSDLVGPAEKVGIEHVLAKPVTESTLYDAISEVSLGKDALQANRRQREELDQAGTARLACLRGVRILLVEDSPLNRQVTLEFLAEVGAKVDTAINGLDGIERVRACQYDVVLMDIQMPEMDGLDATRVLRADPRFAQLPIIAMTAHAMSSDRDLSLTAGMNDHLTKPINPDQMYASILRCVQKGAVSALGDGQSTAQAPTSALPSALSGLAQHGIDVAVGLAHHGRRVGFYQWVLTMFQDEYGSAAQQLAHLLRTNQRDQAHRLFHTLKSASTSIGALTLSKLARDLEFRSRETLPSIEEIAPLEAELGHVLLALSKLKQDLNDTGHPESATHDASKRESTTNVSAMLQQLDDLLADDDAAALEVISPLREAFQGSRHVGQILHIAALVEDVEYEQARAQLGALVSSLANEVSE